MAKKTFFEELNAFRKFLESEANEDAKRHLIHPLLVKIFHSRVKFESDAERADAYIEGQLVVEVKTDFSQWLEGFYQALHYHRKHGLGFHTVMVVAHKFVAIWKLSKLPDGYKEWIGTAELKISPSEIGKNLARRTDKELKLAIKNAADCWFEPDELNNTIKKGKGLSDVAYFVKDKLEHLDSERKQINTFDFIRVIERMKTFFATPMEAIHCFYTMAPYWDATSKIACVADTEKVNVLSQRFPDQLRLSDSFEIKTPQFDSFKQFVENQYLYTNGGSGISVDYYFAVFDEVLATVDPDYVKQHGVFFTNYLMSKFALWFVNDCFSESFAEDYIVFDPAGGSGNLVYSWRGKLKHKIISELNSDLLKIIERRMKIDPFHIETGFTVIPKTSENKGLNFLDKSALEYLNELKKGVKQSANLLLDRPLAFLLNPPYKNTKENERVRIATVSNYEINPDILQITGSEGSRERYLAFLAQILLIAKQQVKEYPDVQPIVCIFTPTSWLLKRPVYIPFREEWDKHFEFFSGFVIQSNEWFKIDGKWPLAFTIWRFKFNEKGNKNNMQLLDCTNIRQRDLNWDWDEMEQKAIDKLMKQVMRGRKKINFSQKKQSIKNWGEQAGYFFIRDETKTEAELRIVGGLPLKDPRRTINKKTYGVRNSEYVGFMDNITPVRIKGKNDGRFDKKHLKKVWFILFTAMMNVNKSKCLSGPPDNRGYCAYDLASARATFTWFAISKALNGRYPIWANQFDIWAPNISKKLEKYWYSLCYAYTLAQNRCVVTKFQANDPVEGAPEVFVDNPLCPTNPESFWVTTLDSEIEGDLPKQLVNKIKEIYKRWNQKYCKGNYLYKVGLKDEPYFQYFDYEDFVTLFSGLVQIKKYAEIHNSFDLIEMFEETTTLSNTVLEEIYKVLTVDFQYFD